MWYKVNYRRLVLLFLPTFLRKGLIVSIANACVTSISRMYASWVSFRDYNVYKIRHNGQVCYLRKVLNDKLDPSLRRIYIGDGYRYASKYFYTRGEKKPRYFGGLFLRERSDYAYTGIDFNVFVSKTIVDSQYYELVSTIETYKMAGKKYKIVAL